MPNRTKSITLQHAGVHLRHKTGDDLYPVKPNTSGALLEVPKLLVSRLLP